MSSFVTLQISFFLAIKGVPWITCRVSSRPTPPSARVSKYNLRTGTLSRAAIYDLLLTRPPYLHTTNSRNISFNLLFCGCRCCIPLSRALPPLRSPEVYLSFLVSPPTRLLRFPESWLSWIIFTLSPLSVLPPWTRLILSLRLSFLSWLLVGTLMCHNLSP